MRNAVVLWLVLVIACGAAEPPTEQPVTSTADVVVADDGMVAEDDDGDDEEVMRCTSDDDCVLGGPPHCCVSTDCEQAWSRVAWEAFRAECAVRDCDRVEMWACLEREGPPPTAACVDSRCVLR